MNSTLLDVYKDGELPLRTKAEDLEAEDIDALPGYFSFL